MDSPPIPKEGVPWSIPDTGKATSNPGVPLMASGFCFVKTEAGTIKLRKKDLVNCL
jgi:hypothetical protein